MAELKPCPFCGGRATVVEHIYYGFQNRYGVVCLDCYAETRQVLHSKDAAIAGWNRRADANSLMEALKRNTTEIVKKANGIYAEYIRNLQERNKALDEELASLLNEADAGLRGGDAE